MKKDQWKAVEIILRKEEVEWMRKMEVNLTKIYYDQLRKCYSVPLCNYNMLIFKKSDKKESPK
jgi:hypothetical protein